LGPEAWLARWIIDPPMVPTLTWRVIFADGVAFFFPGGNLARDALRRPQSHADAHFVSCNEMGAGSSSASCDASRPEHPEVFLPGLKSLATDEGQHPHGEW